MKNLNKRKYKVLIVDDSEINRAILTEILKDDYIVDEAENGKKALEIMQKESNNISLVVLDVVMPEMDGYEVLETMNTLGIIDELPVIMISSESAPGFITKAFDLGAKDYISRPFETAVVLRRVRNTISLFAKQRRLVNIAASQAYEKEKNNNMMISILSHIVEFRNGESGSHIIHINIITELLLKQLMKKTSRYDLSMKDIRLICTASSLHDIGKIAIPDEILNKPGRFTPQEYEIMKTHSEAGASMLKNLSEYQNEPLMKTSYEICRWHHERYDGKGYPDGLKGDDIPISAQIVSIADVYDALTSVRCYKKAFTHEKAIEMICGGECGVFNPLLIECLTDIGDNLQKELHSDTSEIRSKIEIQNITDEIISNNDLFPSGQMLQLLEFERGRSKFFESEIPYITFAYQKNPPLLTLSDTGAKYMGISPYTAEPLKSPEINGIFTESLERLIESAANSTVSEPDFNLNGCILANTEIIECRFQCRTIWMISDKPVNIGTVGIIFLEDDTLNKNKPVSGKETKNMDITSLKQVGINTDTAIERFMGNEALYTKMLKKFLNDGTFASLTKAVSENDEKTALEASHTLKGICGNLSIDTLYELFSRQVILMRADKWNEAYSMMTEISETFNKVTETLTDLLDKQ